jgi:ubiquinone/menaquinone biosynthesis C-methylase UbiE
MQSPAETIPLPDAHFDLITVSLAFHWFDRERFLAEANRLLLPNGWLVISNNYFMGVMQENPGFHHWNTEQYLRRFPTPSRRNHPLTDDDAKRAGFRFAHRETYTNDIRFTADKLAGYLMTQSNVIAAVEQGTASSESVYEWLCEELSLLMSDRGGTFNFAGYIWFMQKADNLP